MPRVRAGGAGRKKESICSRVQYGGVSRFGFRAIGIDLEAPLPGGCDGGAMGAVGGSSRLPGAVVANEVDARFGDEGGEPGDEIERFEEHGRGAVTIGGFEFVAREAVGGQRESFFGERGAGDVAGETFELVACPRRGGQAGMNGEAARPTAPAK